MKKLQYSNRINSFDHTCCLYFPEMLVLGMVSQQKGGLKKGLSHHCVRINVTSKRKH